MLMAARKLQNIGLVLLVLIFAMILYPVSLKVAATRTELARINQDIERSRDTIRYLESEIAVRASMRQLERWNSESFGYSAPSASQYLQNERELASLGRVPRARGANDVAPVLMAMVSPVSVPAATEAVPAANLVGNTAPAAPVAARPAAPRRDAVVPQAAPKTVRVAMHDAVPPPPRRRAQLSMIEDQLLADSTLRDLKQAAAREAREGVRP